MRWDCGKYSSQTRGNISPVFTCSNHVSQKKTSQAHLNVSGYEMGSRGSLFQAGGNASVAGWHRESSGGQQQQVETEDIVISRRAAAAAKWNGNEEFKFRPDLVTRSSSRSLATTHVCPTGFSCVNVGRQKLRRAAKKISMERDKTSSEDLINLLPDECLYEIFVSLPRDRDRRACAAVCRRWLFLQSHFPISILKSDSTVRSSRCPEASVTIAHGRDGENSGKGTEVCAVSKGNSKEDGGNWPPQSGVGDLSRNLDGKKATDVRLASIAVGTAARGGLGELAIKECAGVNVSTGVSDLGLTAIGASCGALRSLSLWNCTRLRDEGLCAIGKGCRLLETLHLSRCPGIGDAAVEAVAEGCPFLTSVTLESCRRIGDAGLKAIGKRCTGLLSFSVINCGIGSEGVEAVVLGCSKMKKMKLEKIGISDRGLSRVGQHCNSLVKLRLSSLKNVGEVGFVSFGRNSSSLLELRALHISACQGLSDSALEVLGRNCRYLKVFSLVNCEAVNDLGLKALTKCCLSLEGLHIEGCNGISHVGLKAALANRGGGLKTLRLSNCHGVRDQGLTSSDFLIACNALKSLSITNCAGVGNICLQMVQRSCLSLEELDLSGLTGVSDNGLIAIVEGMGSGLQRLNLSGCVMLSDQGVCAVAQNCKGSLESLNLDGCVNVTSKTLKVVSEECPALQELDLSKCEITDEGVLTLVASIGSRLKNLSLSGCKLITDRCLPAIGDACGVLWALNLKQCHGLSQQALDSFESRFYKVHLWRP